MKNVGLVIGVLILSLLLSLIFAGCGSSDLYDGEEGEKDTIVIGFSQLGAESDWRAANTNSMKETFTEEEGYTLIFDNARQKQENQIKAIRNFILQEVDYIVLAPVTETGWDTVLQEAKTAGIPVIVVDRMIDVEDDTLYTAWVGSNFHKEGQKAARWLENYLKAEERENEDINIVTLQGTVGSTAQIGRTGGFGEIAAEHKNWRILEQQPGDFTQAKGREVMAGFLEKYPDIDVVVSENDNMAFGAVEAIKAAGKTCGPDGEITVISFDGVKAAFEAMAAGDINVCVECNPLHGPRIKNVIEKLERGDKVVKIQYVDEGIYTAEEAEGLIDERAY